MPNTYASWFLDRESEFPVQAGAERQTMLANIAAVSVLKAYLR
ncbi:hypothetical protein ABZ990_20905 [Streptomyces sp. NPDC046203]